MSGSESEWSDLDEHSVPAASNVSPETSEKESVSMDDLKKEIAELKSRASETHTVEELHMKIERQRAKTIFTQFQADQAEAAARKERAEATAKADLAEAELRRVRAEAEIDKYKRAEANQAAENAQKRNEARLRQEADAIMATNPYGPYKWNKEDEYERRSILTNQRALETSDMLLYWCAKEPRFYNLAKPTVKRDDQLSHLVSREVFELFGQDVKKAILTEAPLKFCLLDIILVLEKGLRSTERLMLRDSLERYKLTELMCILEE